MSVTCDVQLVSRGAQKPNGLQSMTGCRVGSGTIRATHSRPQSYRRHTGHPQALTICMDIPEHRKAAMDFVGGFQSASRVLIERRDVLMWLKDLN